MLLLWYLLLLLLSRFSRVPLCVTHSPPGSPVPGILQARTPEWVAISFCSARKWKEKVKPLSRIRFSVTPQTAAHQAPPSTGSSRQEYWSGLPLPSQAFCHNPLKIGRVQKKKIKWYSNWLFPIFLSMQTVKNLNLSINFFSFLSSICESLWR